MSIFVLDPILRFLSLVLVAIRPAVAPMDLDQENAFQITASHLDKNGISFHYRNSVPERVLFTKLIDAFVTFQQKNVNAPDKDDEIDLFLNPESRNVFDTLEKLLSASGIGAVQSVGHSTVRHEENFFTFKQMFYAPKPLQKGLLWDSVTTRQPHKQDVLSLFPAETLAGIAFDIEPGKLLRDSVAALHPAKNDADNALESILGEFKTLSDDPVGLFDSIRGVAAFLEPGEKGGAVFRATLLLDVDDDSLFQAIRRNFADEKSKNASEFVLPDIEPKVTVFQSGRFLLFTQTPEPLKKRMAGRAENLTMTPDFVRYCNDLPEKNNAFFFLAPLSAERIHELLRERFPNDHEVFSLLQSFAPAWDDMMAGKPLIGIARRNKNGLFLQFNAARDTIFFFAPTARSTVSPFFFFLFSILSA